jgi:hypothetical protein
LWLPDGRGQTFTALDRNSLCPQHERLVEKAKQGGSGNLANRLLHSACVFHRHRRRFHRMCNPDMTFGIYNLTAEQFKMLLIGAPRLQPGAKWARRNKPLKRFFLGDAGLTTLKRLLMKRFLQRMEML